MSSPEVVLRSGHIDVAEQQAVAVVTFRRPEKLNALTVGMRRELAAVLRHFGRGDAARGIAATAEHLRLLRPPREAIEQAFVAETEAARSADESGIARAGIDRFLGRRHDAPGSG